jgi:hypothetical protein
MHTVKVSLKDKISKKDKIKVTLEYRKMLMRRTSSIYKALSEMEFLNGSCTVVVSMHKLQSSQKRVFVWLSLLQNAIHE